MSKLANSLLEGLPNNVNGRDRGRVEVVPLQAACWVVAHVRDGVVTKVEAKISEIELTLDSLDSLKPTPSQKAIDAVLKVDMFPEMSAQALATDGTF